MFVAASVFVAAAAAEPSAVVEIVETFAVVVVVVVDESVVFVVFVVLVVLLRPVAVLVNSIYLQDWPSHSDPDSARVKWRIISVCLVLTCLFR